MPYKPGVPRPYWLELGELEKRDSGEMVWTRHPTTTFATPEAARKFGDKLMQRRWWVVSYRVMGPEGEVPFAVDVPGGKVEGSR